MGLTIAFAALDAQVMPDSAYKAGYTDGRLFACSQGRYRIVPCVTTSLTCCTPGIAAIGVWTATNKEDKGGAAIATFITAPIVPLFLGVSQFTRREPSKLPAGRAASYLEGYRHGYNDAWKGNVARSLLFSSASVLILVGITTASLLLAK